MSQKRANVRYAIQQGAFEIGWIIGCTASLMALGLVMGLILAIGFGWEVLLPSASIMGAVGMLVGVVTMLHARVKDLMR